MMRIDMHVQSVLDHQATMRADVASDRCAKRALAAHASDHPSVRPSRFAVATMLHRAWSALVDHQPRAV